MKNIHRTKEQIDQDIGSIMYLMQINDVIRWGGVRQSNHMNESVGEHIMAMLITARFFLPLVDPEREMDHEKIFSMIMWHDMGEIETGDIPTFSKTAEDSQYEVDQLARVRDKSPKHLGGEIYDAAYEYETGDSDEQKFVKAIDRTGPLFYQLAHIDHLRAYYNERRVTSEMFRNKRAYIAETHPFIFQYVDEINNRLVNAKVFYEDS